MKHLVATILLFSHFASAKAPTAVPVEFEWETIPGAARYEVEIQDQNKKRVDFLQSKDEKFNLELPPGNYLVRGRVLDSRNAFSKWSALSDFVVAPQKVKLSENSIPQEVIPSKKNHLAPVRMEWESSKGADSYRVELFNEKNKQTKVIETKENNIEVQLYSGVYSYKLIAIAANKVESEPVEGQQRIHVPELQLEPPKNLILEKQNISWQNETEFPVVLEIEYRRFQGTWKKMKEELSLNNSYSLPQELKPGEYRFLVKYKSPTGAFSPATSLVYIKKPLEQDLK